MAVLDIIQNTPYFKGIDSEIVDELLGFRHRKRFVKGQTIFSAGEQANSFFIILKGWVKLNRISRSGEETVIHVFGPTESFAEAAVFGSVNRYPVTAEAVTKTSLIEIPRSFFIKQIERDSAFALSILASISAHQHYLVSQLEQVATRNAPQRIGTFLLRFCSKSNIKNGEIVVKLPYDKSLISTRLNIKPETFSRALAKLEPYGVRLEGRKIIINNLDVLTEFSDCS